MLGAPVVNLSIVFEQQSQLPGRVVVVVVDAVEIVVVVGVGQLPGCGLHVRTSLSLSTFFGLSLEEAMTEMVHFPGFFPFFLVLTVMPVKAPHSELMPAGVGRSPVTLHPIPFALTFLRLAAVHVPRA